MKEARIIRTCPPLMRMTDKEILALRQFTRSCRHPVCRMWARMEARREALDRAKEEWHPLKMLWMDILRS